MLLGWLSGGEGVEYGIDGLLFRVFETISPLNNRAFAVAFHLVHFMRFGDVLIDADDVTVSIVDLLFLLEEAITVEELYFRSKFLWRVNVVKFLWAV